MRSLLGVAFSLVLIADAAAQAPDLTDAQAKRGIEINWNRRLENLAIGERVVVKDIPAQPCTSENISVSQYEFLLGAEKAGYVTISYWREFKEFSKGKTFTPAEMVELAASGVVKKFTVLPTKKAQAVQVSLKVTGRTGCLAYKIGTYAIDKVLRNEPQAKKSATFRIVSVTYRVAFEPMVKEIQAAGNIKLEPDRKALVLIQYDPPRKNWNIAALDAANASEEFKTNNVATYLDKQQ